MSIRLIYRITFILIMLKEAVAQLHNVHQCRSSLSAGWLPDIPLVEPVKSLSCDKTLPWEMLAPVVGTICSLHGHSLWSIVPVPFAHPEPKEAGRGRGDV